ncbi:CGNR zinc finger domain-containing protein [Amycolatopsis anabasis]|uniref:CGNR zinc finger domain-containing protein n=1 Tax=Amycolatopsis anabasis TaxID=1840409 RepID=UPI00131B8BC1|nr:CGNR zinc finger domain-containing protein [Amycolatopsis anabasis]
MGSASRRPWLTIGGHVALDLCNTRAWRLDPARSIDRLHGWPDLLDWYATVCPDAAPLGEQGKHAAELDRVRTLRDTTIAVLDAHLDGHDPGADQLGRILTEYRRFLRAATPEPGLPLRLHVTGTDAATLPPRLCAHVVNLLRDADLTRLRRCDGPGCGSFFLDPTRNRSRRWCDPDDCGNRHRVREYARRHPRTSRKT